MSYGNLIKATAKADASFLRDPQNLCGNHGMSGSFGIEDICSNDGEYTYVTTEPYEKAGVTFDLGGIKSLAYMFVYNLGMPGFEKAGMRKIKIFISQDGQSFEEFKGKGYPYILAKARPDGKASNLDDGKNSPVDFGGQKIAYVRIVPDGDTGEGNYGIYVEKINAYALSKVRFYETLQSQIHGEFETEPANQWSAEFSRMDGWGGADGIFCVPLDGVEKRGGLKKSLMIFSDTFIGKSNPHTKRRSTVQMVNNTMAFVTNEGDNKRKFKFVVNKTPDKKYFDSIIKAPKGCGYYYWLQDPVVVGENIYIFTDNIQNDPTGPEGFRFKVVGIDMLKIPIVNGKPQLDKYTSCHTPLFTGSSYFGCCIFPNTVQSGYPNPDGYVYVYGLGGMDIYGKRFLVARVPEADFENFDKYTFFNGKEWVADINQAVSISDDGGAECSVTPISSGKYAGKFMYTHMKDGIGNTVVVSFADNPWGPFDKDLPIYMPTDLEEIGGKAYTYNAKAHYHLSPSDGLLISYNINARNYQHHIDNCDVYRPRFIKLKGF